MNGTVHALQPLQSLHRSGKPERAEVEAAVRTIIRSRAIASTTSRRSWAAPPSLTFPAGVWSASVSWRASCKPLPDACRFKKN
jgi:hypothetical protein